MRGAVMKPWLLPALILAVAAAPMGMFTAPTVAVAQAQDGRVLGPAQVRGLRLELARAEATITNLRGAEGAARRSAVASRADLMLVAQMLGMAANSNGDEIREALLGWAEADERNRAEIARMTDLVGRLEVGEVRNTAEYELQLAGAAFELGRLDDAQAALSRLEHLRLSSLVEARSLWVDGVLARSNLARQQQDFEQARQPLALARRQGQAQWALTEWRFIVQEASIDVAEYDVSRSVDLLVRAVDQLRNEAVPLLEEIPDEEAPAMTYALLGAALSELGVVRDSPQLHEEAVLTFETLLTKETTRGSNFVPGLRRAFAESLSRLGAARSDAEPQQRALQILESEVLVSEEGSAQASLLVQRGHTRINLGKTLRDTSIIGGAFADFANAQVFFPQETMPVDWARVEANRGFAFLQLGILEEERRLFEEAEAALTAAASIFEAHDRTADRANALMMQGMVRLMLAQNQPSLTAFQSAVATFDEANTLLDRRSAPLKWAMVQSLRMIPLLMVAGFECSFDQVFAFEPSFAEAVAIMEDAGSHEAPTFRQILTRLPRLRDPSTLALLFC